MFAALDDPAEVKPTLSSDNLLILELIREFLEYNRCKYTASVLVSGTAVSRGVTTGFIHV